MDRSNSASGAVLLLIWVYGSGNWTWCCVEWSNILLYFFLERAQAKMQFMASTLRRRGNTINPTYKQLPHLASSTTGLWLDSSPSRPAALPNTCPPNPCRLQQNRAWKQWAGEACDWSSGQPAGCCSRRPPAQKWPLRAESRLLLFDMTS